MEDDGWDRSVDAGVSLDAVFSYICRKIPPLVRSLSSSNISSLHSANGLDFICSEERLFLTDTSELISLGGSLTGASLPYLRCRKYVPQTTQ